jgi:hypothetical protein
MSAKREQVLFPTFSPPGTAKRPVAWFFTQTGLYGIILDVFDRFVEVFFVPCVPIKIIVNPEFACAPEYLIRLVRRV